MRLFLNELSLHGQFYQLDAFKESMSRVMNIRRIAEGFGYPVYCKGEIVNRPATPTESFARAVNRALSRNQRQDIMIWIGNRGPFWEEESQHDYDAYMEYRGNVVTESSVGEAAYFVEHEQGGGLVSFAPSDWDETPVRINRISSNDNNPLMIPIPNYRNGADLKVDLQKLEPPLSNWDQLESRSRSECANLTFSSECFGPLAGIPFQRGTANGIRRRLKTLNELMGMIGPAGEFTQEGIQFWEQHFVGKNVRFSDSSDTEKNESGNDLTFPHPSIAGEKLFCPWHGKVQRIRIHFSLPETHDPHLYVVYVGNKRTQR